MRLPDHRSLLRLGVEPNSGNNQRCDVRTPHGDLFVIAPEQKRMELLRVMEPEGGGPLGNTAEGRRK